MKDSEKEKNKENIKKDYGRVGREIIRIIQTKTKDEGKNNGKK